MERPLILFAPGAGAPSTSAWMVAWKRRLEAFGHVVPFDYAYMREGRRSPDRLPKLVEAHRAALEAARQEHPGPVVLAGKSMGGRIGCHLSLEVPVDALVCFGYPLKAASARGDVRDAVLVALRTKVLFIQGTRDPLCPLDLLATVRPRMTAQSELHVVEGGDHSLEVRVTELKRQQTTRDGVEQRISSAIGAFLAARG